MTEFSTNIGKIHFAGIGGIGMSGIAEVMLNLGYQIQGSDLRESPIISRLRKLGAEIFIGQHADNLGTAKIMVVSSAIQPDNPELVEARNRLIPVVRRAEMLAELMRLKHNVAVAGTHGKTTTTSLIAAILDAGDKDPTVINGGIIQSYDSNARLGKGDWLVAEADESDGTFVRLPATIGVVTNIDPEHLDHYGDIEALRDAFVRFGMNVPFYGALVCCIDHPEVQSLIGRLPDRRIVTYGFSPQADIRVDRLSYEHGTACFDVHIRSRRTGEERTIEDLRLPLPGDHNVSNALAAIGVARELQISDEAIREALANFSGVKRRFTNVGQWNGVTLIDDYGHHPVEIAAALKAARESTPNGRVIAVHQPHRYSRLQTLFADFCGCFNQADIAIIADVYAAGELPIEGVSRDTLVQGLRAHGHRHVVALESEQNLPELIRAEAQPGDIVICLGAGSISTWANDLQKNLDQAAA